MPFPPVRNNNTPPEEDSSPVEDRPAASDSGALSKTRTPSKKRKREQDSGARQPKQPRVEDPGSASRSASAFDEDILNPIITGDVDKVMRALNESGYIIISKSDSLSTAMKRAFTDSTTDSKVPALAKKTVKRLKEKPEVEIKERDIKFLRALLVGYLDNIQIKYFKEKKKKVDDLSNDAIARVATQDFGITENLVHELDAESLIDELDKVLDWHGDATIREQYLAPILPIVQCSGTGKSRLLRWLRKDSKHQKYSRIVLLSKQEKAKVENKGNYDKLYAVGTMNDSPSSLEQARTRLRKLVKKLCKDILRKLGNEVKGKVCRCILLFDEAQHLTDQNGFLLRALCSITREKKFEINNKLCKLTVVLAGTNSSLTNNFYNDKEEEISGSSRYLPEKVDYYESGEERFPPFFLLRTMGCLAGKFPENSDNTEYERMIRFSRPLFAMMQKKKMEIPEYQIANKIVLGNTAKWIKSEESCLSVLGTRVQMGSTNEALVADLVSKGYAHLTDFQEGTKEIPGRSSFAFLPDPVCARLAMCLMDKDIKLKGLMGGLINGASKTDVVKMFGRIFSSGLCLPEKGNYGEIAVALYLLLCGDVLRKKAVQNDETSRQYHKLSVDFHCWMNIVENGGKVSNKSNSSSRNEMNNEDKQKANGTFQLNCIQFFRNPLHFPLETLATDAFLKPLYEKGCAIYCPTNMEAVDLVIPLKKKTEDAINKPGDDEYFPVFVSVKNYGHMCPKTAAGFLETSLNKLNDEDVKTGVLLLAITGQDRPIQKESQETWQDTFQKTVFGHLSDTNIKAVDATLSDVHKKLVARIVLIHEDVFGIHGTLLAGGIQSKQQTSEVYQYHSELLHRDLGNENLGYGSNKYRTDVKAFMENTMNCIEKEKVKNTNAASSYGVDATDASE